MFQPVKADNVHSTVQAVTEPELDPLPGDGDDPRYQATDTVDKDKKDNNSIGFKVDKTSDINTITFLEKEKTLSNNPKQRIPEDIQHEDPDYKNHLNHDVYAKVKKAQADQEANELKTNDIELLVFSSLEMIDNVTSVETILDNMSMEDITNNTSATEQVCSTENVEATVLNKSSTALNHQHKNTNIHSLQDDADVEIVQKKYHSGDVVYILYLSKDSLDDISNKKD